MPQLTDRLSLPQEVRDRLHLTDEDGQPVPTPGVSVRVRRTVEEARPSCQWELRTTEDGGLGVEGYAATWGVPYDVAGGPELGGWTETIERGAVDRALTEAPDIRLLVNHDADTAFGLPLARTSSGTLSVTSERIGLRMDAPELDPADPVVQHVRSVLSQGNADQMSWAFRVARRGQEWNDDYTERRITNIARVYDVSIVTYPANEATAVGLRSEGDDDDEIEDRSGGMSLTLARAFAQQTRSRVA